MEPSRDNCYPNTTCLINKFGVKDDRKLSEIETEITFAKAAILESEEAELPLDFGFYKYIHCFLFEDLYDWAGKLRKVDISKKRTAFCPVKELESSCKACFNRHGWVKILRCSCEISVKMDSDPETAIYIVLLNGLRYNRIKAVTLWGIL